MLEREYVQEHHVQAGTFLPQKERRGSEGPVHVSGGTVVQCGRKDVYRRTEPVITGVVLRRLRHDILILRLVTSQQFSNHKLFVVIKK
jgi:hypothetical protein